jgi:type VI secretion system secreted protein Hcp
MAAYLKFDSIKTGSATAKNHSKKDGWIEVQSVQFGVGRHIPMVVGSGTTSASPPNVSEIVVTKSMDDASPWLFQESLKGKGNAVKVHLVEGGEDGPDQPYLEVDLTDALISGYSVSSGGDRPHESISFAFKKIEYRYIPFDDKHKPQSAVPVKYNVNTGATE